VSSNASVSIAVGDARNASNSIVRASTASWSFGSARQRLRVAMSAMVDRA
jgi:hypothetical protein